MERRVETGDLLTWSEVENLYLQATLFREGKPVRFYTGLVKIEFRNVSSVTPIIGLPGIAKPAEGRLLETRKDGGKLIVTETGGKPEETIVGMVLRRILR